MFGWLPGASEQDIIDRELANGDLNNRGTGFADRTGSCNWQDSFGAWLAGSSKEKVLAGAKKKRDKQLEDAYGGRASTAAANGPLQASYQGASGQTEQEMKAQLALDEGKAKALQTVMANNPDFDFQSLAPTATSGAIYGAGAKATKKAKEKARDGEREYNRGLLEETREYNAGLLREANLRADRKEEAMLLREDRKDARARLERLEDRKMEMELRGDEMKFKYAQLAQQDRLARQDKKDRAMMALIQGLGNLGAAFTV